MNPAVWLVAGVSGKPGAGLVAEELDQLVVALVGRETCSARVSAAAHLAGDDRDVDRAVGRAQADLARLALALGLVADDRGDGCPLDPADEVDDPFGEAEANTEILESAPTDWQSIYYRTLPYHNP